MIKPLLLFNHQLTRPSSSAKGSAKGSSGAGTTPVLSVTKFIHGEAKGEVMNSLGPPALIYMNISCFHFQVILQLVYFWCLKLINSVIWKQISYQFRHLVEIISCSQQLHNTVNSQVGKDQIGVLRTVVLIQKQLNSRNTTFTSKVSFSLKLFKQHTNKGIFLPFFVPEIKAKV